MSGQATSAEPQLAARATAVARGADCSPVTTATVVLMSRPRAVSRPTTVEALDLDADSISHGIVISHGSRPDLLCARDLDVDGLVCRLLLRPPWSAGP